MDQGPARGVAAHADRPWAAAAAVAGALGAAALTVLAARARLHAGKARQASSNSVAASLRAADAEQVQMMSEEIIVVDEADTALRAGSKKETHEWKAIKGDKLLHRAFSVFLLSPDGRLLVQQRSDAKVTFPGYWANTCCSHPWYIPEEMIVEGGQGVKVAARRKLQQELGIDPEDVPLECFTFLTRVHYEAMCDDGVWGEHEVDHVLIATPKATPTLRVNANEVQAVKWLTLPELKSWMAAHAAADSTGATADKVSPWFRIISEQHLPTWWEAVLADQSDGIPPPVQLAAYKPWWSLTPSTEQQTGMPQERQQTKFTYRLLALLALLHGLSATAAWAVPGRARLDPPVRGGSGARGGAAGGPSHPSNSSSSARVAMGFTGLLLVNARRAAVADPDPGREPVELAAVARTGFAGDLNRLDAWEGSAVASMPSLRHICRKAL